MPPHCMVHTHLIPTFYSCETVEPSPQPPDLLDEQISLLPPVVIDPTPPGVKFGDVETDVPPNSTFSRVEMVTFTFWSACPRNGLMIKGTFALVEILQNPKTWQLMMIMIFVCALSGQGLQNQVLKAMQP